MLGSWSKQAIAEWQEEKNEWRQVRLATSRFMQRRSEYRKRLAEWFDMRCLRCGKAEKVVIDHIVPLSKGGANHVMNMQFLCRNCNSHKNSKIVDYRSPGVVRIMSLVYYQK